MPTPKQAPKTIETPFGTATVYDWRDHNTPKVTEKYFGNREIASIGFKVLTVNRKEYRDMTLYVTHYSNHTGNYIGTGPYRYDALTKSARDKINDYFTMEHEAIAPLLEDVDATDARRLLKHDIAYKALDHLHKTVTMSDDPKLHAELLDEIYAEVQRQRQDGKDYHEIARSF